MIWATHVLQSVSYTHLDVYKRQFMSRVTMVEVPEGQLGILYINHAASAVVIDREAAYWNVWEPLSLIHI